MRLLIDCSNYFLNNNNNGDKAIYQIMLKRLTEFWPDARIKLITLDPALIRQNFPGVEPFVLKKRHHWQLFGPGTTGLARRGFSPAFRHPLRFHLRDLMPRALKRQAQTRLHEISEMARFLSAFRWADLVIATGGGYLNDAFPDHARGVLDTLEGGLIFGKPAVIMGGGFEPITNPMLRAKAQSVFPRLNLVACREQLTAPLVLQDFGVSQDRIAVTGDDAVELAYSARPETLGTGIGVNLRQATYSEVDDGPIETIRAVLHEAARKFSAPLLPIPISMFGPSDVESIKTLLHGFEHGSDGGASLDTPLKVIQQTGKCRVVVTGSYHAAVFALSQGIPTIALAKSMHYVIKLRGLQAQFGSGCSLLLLDNPDLKAVLTEAINEAWSRAEHVRQSLLESAREQIALGRAAYQRVYRLMSS